jgi:hypothetical protein
MKLMMGFALTLIVTIALFGAKCPHFGRIQKDLLNEAQTNRLHARSMSRARNLREGAPIRYTTEIAAVANDGGALEQMRRREISGAVFVTSRPVNTFVKEKWDEGFKFLPKFEDYYIPSYIDSADYPNLIAKGARIATIAVPSILTSLSLSAPRYLWVARFVDQLFGKVSKPQPPNFDPQWRSVNFATQTSGFQPFQAAQEWLDRARTAKPSEHA